MALSGSWEILSHYLNLGFSFSICNTSDLEGVTPLVLLQKGQRFTDDCLEQHCPKELSAATGMFSNRIYMCVVSHMVATKHL